MNSVGAISDIPVFGDSSAKTTTKPTNKDDFLTLLVAQMRFQDPMNPMEGTEFASQLAQFTQVEELQNMNSKLDASNESNQLLALSVNNTLATTLIGKQVKAVDDSLTFDGSHDVTINYTLPSLTAPVKIEITNSSGTVIRTIQLPNGAQGDNSETWDGRDGRGNKVPSGTYTVSITGTNTAGGATTGTPIAMGRIEGVRFENGTPVLIIDGRPLSFGSVLEILESTDSSSLMSRLLSGD